MEANKYERYLDIFTGLYNRYKYELAFSYGFAKTKSLNLINSAFEKADIMMFQEKEKKGY